MEIILCAAIWFPNEPTPVHNYKNIPKGCVWCGIRHYIIISSFVAKNDKTMEQVEYTQGFITSKNCFVNRIEAGEIAFKAGQTKERKGQLTSEDIY